MKLPKIALVGRPNVGKSALFNRICGSRVSIVDEQEGITRDRLYAKSDFFGRPFTLIDTGGIDEHGKLPFNDEVKIQAYLAIEEADAIIQVVDGQAGPTLLDEEVSRVLLKSGKPVVVAVNKIDNIKETSIVHAFHSLAIPKMVAVSATQGYQIAELIEEAIKQIPIEEVDDSVPEGTIRVSIVGRANVGKSTLLNQLIGDHRSIVSPIAGTTRDAVDSLIKVEDQHYYFVDTAGIRRKKAEREVVDKFAAIRTEEAIEKSEVCLLVLDAFEGVTAQEKRIATDIEEKGKSCIILLNKWDMVKNFRMEHAMQAVREEFPFAPILFISAQAGRNLEKIFPLIQEVYRSRYMRIATGPLNSFIELCLQKYHPPVILNKRLRIYYMTQVQVGPPRFAIFVNNPTLMTDSYKRYLMNQFRAMYGFLGCPLIFSLRGKSITQAKREGPVVQHT